MLEAAKQETSLTCQGHQHSEEQQDHKVSSPKPVSPSGKHQAVAVIMLLNTLTLVINRGTCQNSFGNDDFNKHF